MIGPAAAVAVVLSSVIAVIMLSRGAQPAATGPIASTTTTASTAPTTVPTVPLAVSLVGVVRNDAGPVSALAGHWVPQVSSKAVGTSADGIVYGEDDILADHLRLRREYPNAVLLRSDRFPTFASAGFYVTVIAQPYSTPGDANAWCDAAGLPPDACFAKLLALTPVKPSTVHR